MKENVKFRLSFLYKIKFGIEDVNLVVLKELRVYTNAVFCFTHGKQKNDN